MYARIKAGLFGKPRPVILSAKRTGVRNTIMRKTWNSIATQRNSTTFTCVCRRYCSAFIHIVQLSVLCKVANRLGFPVNLEKTKIVDFRNGGYLARAERWYYGSEPVSVASSYKYLGLKFTTKFCLNRISEDSVPRAKQRTVEIFKVLRNIGCFDINVFFKLFLAQIAPILLCCSELWGCFDCPSVEKVYMYACKRMSCLSSQISNHMVYGEPRRHHLSVLAATGCERYWLRINNCPVTGM